MKTGKGIVLIAAALLGFSVYAESKYYGLFVGINEYSNGVSSLIGCDRDVAVLRDAYTTSGFCAEADASSFLDYAATKAAVRAKFNELAAAAQPGDTVLYYQSSHGGDYNSGDDADKGACLCMTDDDWRDAEFAEDLAKFNAGVRVVVVIDACYSGGMFKSAGAASAKRKGTWNFARRVNALLSARRTAAKKTGAKGIDLANVGWITASDWNELSGASSAGSVFTNALLAGWRNGAADGNGNGQLDFSELAEYAKKHVGDNDQTVQSSNDSFLAETPAGTPIDISAFRMICSDGTLYGFYGPCPAEIEIPDGTAVIGVSAFDSDYNGVGALESVTIPSSVTNIADYAFYGCTNLVSVTFVGNEEDVEIGRQAFYGTPWGEERFPPPTNDDFENAEEIEGTGGSIEGTNVGASSVDGEPLLDYAESQATVWYRWTAPANGTYVFDTIDSDFDTVMGVYTGDAPNSLTVVDENDDAYEDSTSCVSFEAVAGTVYYVAVGGYEDGEGTIVLNWYLNDGLFRMVAVDGIVMGFSGNCPRTITAEDWPADVTGIGGYVFEDCYDLRSVTIPASVRDIGEYAFGGCQSLATVTFKGDRDEIEIDPSAFDYTPWGNANMPFVLAMSDDGTQLYGYHGASPVSLEVPDGVRSIDSYAFSGCETLCEVIIPTNVTSIGSRAFASCGNLARAFLPQSLEGVIDEESVFRESQVPVYYYEGEFPTLATVTLNANGGIAVLAICHAVPGNAIRKLPEATRTGYVFLGWFTAVSGGAQVTADTVVTGDMTLYAHWEKIVYTYNYIDNGDGTVTLSRYDEDLEWVSRPIVPEPVGEFAVPDEIDGKQVVGIGDDVFWGNYGITSIIIPANVTNISSSAFTFACDLINITVASGNPAYKDIDGVLYTKDGKTLVACPCAKAGDVVVVSGTEHIGEYAFCENGSIVSVTLPDGLRTIGYEAFGYCGDEDFVSVTIPASVELIDSYAFAGCSSLEVVTFAGSEGDIDISDTAFIGTPYDAAKPFSLIVEDGMLLGIHGAAPANLDLSDYLEDGQTLTSIDIDALSSWTFNTTALTSLVIPEGVTSIGDYAFQNCYALESVTLPASLKEIQWGAFQDCSSLREIWIPGGVEFMGNDVFDGCEWLTVHAPDTLRDTFTVPSGCSIEYYDKYTVTLSANGGSFGGEPTQTVTVREGVAISTLPLPVMSGYVFCGWFTAAEGGDRVTAETVVSGDMTLYAHWEESPFSATGGDAAWSVDAEGRWRSGEITDDQTTWVEITVTNAPCQVSFRWKTSSERGYDKLHCYLDGDEMVSPISGTMSNWKNVSFVVTEAGNHTIRFEYTKDGSVDDGEDCGWIDGIAFTPAPESMTVTFVTNGGEAIAPTNVTPGITYGELPVPQKEGLDEFGGWYLDEGLTEKAYDSDPVVFHDVTLYAKWTIPVSVLDIEGVVEFSTDEEYYDDYIILPWEAVEDAEADRGYVLRGPDSESYLYAKVTGLGTLSFRWRVTGAGKSGWQEFRISELYEYYDEVDDEYYEDWILISDFGNMSFRPSAQWQDFSIVCTAPTNTIEFHTYGRDAAVNICDFVWTPAPEKMTVSFDTTGGGEIDPLDFVPGDTYGELPVPTFGEWTFLGWYENDLSGKKVESSTLVSFRENITLVAKWGKPANTFAADGLAEFTASGEIDTWRNVYTPDQGMLEVEPQGVVESSEWYGIRCEGTSSRIQATTTAEGYMQFRFSLKNGGRLADGGYSGNGPYASIAVCLDDQKVTDAEVWGFDEETGEQQVRVFVPAGEHVLSWNVEGRRAYSYTGGYWDWDDELEEEIWVDVIEEFGSAPVVRVWGFDFEPAGPQESLQQWSGKVKNFRSWRTGDLSRFAAEYKARMENDANDYEARILYAVTRLGALAEDRQFTDYAKTFDLTVDWARLSVTPPKPTFGEDSAAINEMVDKTLELASPAIADAQAALADIPEDWTGSVTLKADEWPIDETVVIDVADVLFTRAGLDAALAGLNYIAAYDLTTDWTKAGERVERKSPIPVLDELPGIDDDAGWNAGRRFRTKAWVDVEGSSKTTGAVAFRGDTVALLVTSPVDITEECPLRKIWFDISSGDITVEADWYCDGDELYQSQEISLDIWHSSGDNTIPRTVPATVTIAGGKVLLLADFSKVFAGHDRDGRALGEREWTMGRGAVRSLYQDVYWDAPKDGARRLQKFLDDQTAFFSRIRDADRLDVARSSFKAALERALVADGKATARQADGPMHFFEYDPEFAQMIAFARTNTRRALASLDASVEVDMTQFAADYDAAFSTGTKMADCNYTLLPNEGVTRIYLGALFEGRITRAMKPRTSIDAYGELKVDFDSLSDPTFGGLLPDMTAEALGNFVNGDVSPVEKVTVTFNANGGDCSEPKRVLAAGTPLGELPDDPVRTGYAFNGWFAADGLEADPNALVLSNETITAQWTANRYTVKFDANGGEGEMSDAAWTYGAATNLTAVGFARVGHTFAGWATSATGEVAFVDGAVTSNLTTVAGGTVTFFAAWTVNKYTLTFDSAGGSDVASITQDYGTEVATPADPSRTGYTFTGWRPAVPATIPAEDITCVAQWAVNLYTVSFDANGGEGEMADVAWTYDAATNLAAVGFTRVGHTFAGWATNEMGEVVFADGAVVSNLTDTAGGSVTLFAVWTVNQYTLTFDSAGGSDVASITQDYGTAVTAPAAPTKVGYTFAGWSPALPETMPLDGGSFTARWTANRHMVHFDLNGGSMDEVEREVEYGATYGELPVPVKELHVFVGWALDGVAVENDTPVTIDADHTLVAQWTINSAAMTFGGAADWTHDPGSDTWRSGAIGHNSSSWMSITVVGPVAVSFDQKTSSESGYDYLTVYVNGSSVKRMSGTSGSWDSQHLVYLNEGETNVIRWTYSKDGSVSRGDDCAYVRNLRIDYSLEILTLALDPAGGSLDDAEMKVLAGYAVGTLPTPYREGHEFLGWFDADGRRVTTATVFEESAELVAHWSLRQYYVSFNANGGIGGTSRYVYYGHELTAPVVTRTGYTFAGWSPAVPDTMPAYSATFYAQWTVNRHRIAFDANGGEGGTSGEADYGSAVSAPVVSREGYVFIGWEPEVQGSMPDADRTYMAQWRELSPGVALHAGTITEDAVWSADVTHLVSGNVDVADGVSLVIEAGAVVKFMTGAALRVSSRAACTAGGAVFTHANDNTAGVGVFADGEYDDVPMSAYTISGMVEDDEDTEYRYTLATLSGNITSYTNLRGHRVYVVSNSVTVARGTTLAIRPGAVLKFLPGRSLVVNGTLSAQGNRAAPIVFTSIKDDEHGGDTNGDGGATVAQAGDWVQIKVPGTANFNYCHVLYNSSAENTGAIDAYGGRVTFLNSEIAHTKYECVNAHSSGYFTARNSVFRDSSLGFGYYGGNRVQACNCVFADLTTAIRQSNKQLVNCIFYRCLKFYDQSGNYSSFANCLFYNPSGFGSQSSEKTGTGGNMWADPRFVDAANGDFRIAADSPCVDAGNTLQAPENDMYGQPRMDVGSVSDRGLANADGVCADIGIYEVPGRVATPTPDIAVLAITVSQESVNVGDELTVVYTVTNCGSAAASGTVRDRFVFRGADGAVGGMTVEAATLEQRYSLEAGAIAEVTATFKVLGMAAGAWTVGLEVNPYRDVFERNFANNSAWSAGVVEVDVEALAESSSALTVAHGTSVGYILGAVPAEGGVVRITGGTEGVSAAFGVGAMPAAAGESGALRLSDGSILAIIPAHEEGEKVYVSIENSGYADAQVTIEAQASATAIYDVSPARIPNAGTASLTITGSGLDASTALTLGGVAASEVSVLNSAQVLATFNVDSMASGTKSVTAGGTSKSVEVYNVKMGPKLRAWLEKPASVRDGRVYTAYVCYANEGDSPMTMPVFKVSRRDSSTKMGLTASENLTETVLYVGGISPTHPAGVLKAGDEARIPFYFQPFGSYNIRLTHIRDVDNASAYPTFGGTREYLAAMASVATRLNLRGKTEYAIDDFRAQALAEMSGAPCAAVSGYLLDAKTHEPIANATVSLVADDMDADLAPSVATTDETGYYQLSNLSNGEYRFLLADGNMLSPASTNTVTISSQGDINGLDVYATPGGRIAGYVMTDAGEPISGGMVTLLNASGTVVAATVADGFGAFAFSGLSDGDYSVRTMPSGGYASADSQTLAINSVARSAEVVFALVQGACISGVVTYEGAVVTNGIVQAINEDGTSVQTLCGTNGVYRFDGIKPNNYAVRYYSNVLESEDVWVSLNAGDSMNLDISTVLRPLFEPTHSKDYGSCTTAFVFTDPVRAEGVTAWAWDFDSDGIVDSTAAEPTWTYSSLGTNTVTLTITEAVGKTTSVYRNCVIVERKLDTILAAGAIVFGENSGTLVTEAVTDTTLTLSGNPESGVIDVGNVILGKMGNEWYCRRVARVSKVGGKWQLETVAATWDEAYEQCTLSATGTGYMEEEPTRVSATKDSRLSKAASNKKKFPLYAEFGVDASVTVNPSVQFEYEREKVDGKVRERYAFVGRLIVGGEIGLQGTIGVKPEKEFKLPFNIVIPTPIAGVTLENDWKGYVEGDVHVKGSATIGGEVNTALRLGCEWEKGKKPHWLKPFDVTSDGHMHGDVEGSASIKIGIKPEFKAKLAGTASAVLALDAYVQAGVTASAKAPVEAGVSMGLDLIGELNLVDWDFKFIDVKLGISGTVKGPHRDILKWYAPNPDFDYAPNKNLEAPVTVQFTDKSEGAHWQVLNSKITSEITGYEWDLGNGLCSNLRNPTATYSKKGTYTVSLRAKGSGINGPYRKKKKIKVGEKDRDGEEETDDTEGDSSRQSWDPNEVTGSAGVGDMRYVKPGEELEYTIYFENKEGFDIADAQEVRVTNPLSPYLDVDTFRMKEVAFNNQIDLGLYDAAVGTNEVMLAGTNRSVITTLSGVAGGEATWYMRIYDPSPDALIGGWPKDGSGFLPSNDETHRGEGHITYKIKVRDDAPAGVVITNSATIVFDKNAPIETDPAWWNTVAGLANVTIDGEEDGETQLIVGMPYGDALPEKPSKDKPGYKFAGWRTGPNGTGRLVTAESTVQAGDRGIYASWNANTYNVVFHANGGDGEMPNQTMTYDLVSCLASNAFVKLGSDFAGWATNETGEAVFEDGEEVTNLSKTDGAVINLYAVWADAIPVVDFVEDALLVHEGSNALVRVFGGNVEKASSVKVYLTYNTATAADVNLGKTKYPVTLKWAKGEIGEKTVTIPVKADTLVEGEEFFTLQLAAANGVEHGTQTVCTVRIVDAQWNADDVEAATSAALPAGATVVSNASGVVTGYFTKKDKKGNVTAKAMPGYIFTGWYDAKGKSVSTKAALADKTRKSKKATPRFAVAHYLRGLADPANGGKVTGSGLYAEKKSVTLKATPNKYWTFEGWFAARSASGPYQGDASISKSKSLKVSVTNELTYLAMFKPYPKVTVAVDNAKGGTVKGAGSYLAGKTVTLTATPKKGYAFCGWFDAEGNLVSLNASYKYKVTADGLALSASFKKESALAKPVLTWDATNLTVGVSYSAKPSVVGESLVSVTKVTGLPKGLTFKSGKVSGVPTVAKAVTAKVTVALKSNAKKTWTYSVKLNVSALPTWAVGTFKGTLYDGEGDGAAAKGTLTLTVGKTGKVSGKFVDTKKKSYSFSVASFKTFDDGVLRTKATMKYGKKSVTVEVAVGQDGETSVGFAEVGSTAAPFSGVAAQLNK